MRPMLRAGTSTILYDNTQYNRPNRLMSDSTDNKMMIEKHPENQNRAELS